MKEYSMRLITIGLVAIFAVTTISAGKIKWDSNGNPILEKPTKPIKGCQKQSLEELVEDKNGSNCKK